MLASHMYSLGGSTVPVSRSTELIAHVKAGLAAYNLGDYEAAASEFKKYVADNPTDPRYAIAYYLLGRSYLQLPRR